MDIFLVLLLITAIGSLLACLHAEDKVKMLLYMVAFTSSLGIAFVYVGALFAGIFQLLIYAGVLTVLFTTTTYMVYSQSPQSDGGVSL